MTVKVGDFYPVWWATGQRNAQGQPLAVVFAVNPYRGLYPEWFSHVLVLKAPHTKRGWLDMAVDLRSTVTSNCDVENPALTFRA